ncbi:MAG: methylmalonyl-CoA mutase family protein, partial [Anaerolineae bacterium]|nr:methylmalonyl-CoA mutase family protein [Anaerolineae bacterium]
PLGGSYFVEELTDKMEAEAWHYFEQIEALGGVLPAIEAGFFQQEIADAAYRYQREIDTGQRTIVGINDFVSDEPIMVPILEMDPQGYETQCARLGQVRATRDDKVVAQCLADLRTAALGSANLMPYILAAVKAYTTLQEIMDVFREVFGEYQEPTII